jgi:hypothetical protein
VLTGQRAADGTLAGIDCPRLLQRLRPSWRSPDRSRRPAGPSGRGRTFEDRCSQNKQCSKPCSGPCRPPLCSVATVRASLVRAGVHPSDRRPQRFRTPIQPAMPSGCGPRGMWHL